MCATITKVSVKAGSIVLYSLSSNVSLGSTFASEGNIPQREEKNKIKIKSYALSHSKGLNATTSVALDFNGKVFEENCSGDGQYDAFWNAAKKYRYDIDMLSNRFDVSFEQVCHRLTTLNKQNQKGIITGVKRGTASLLSYLDKENIKLGDAVKVLEIIDMPLRWGPMFSLVSISSCFQLEFPMIFVSKLYIGI